LDSDVSSHGVVVALLELEPNVARQYAVALCLEVGDLIRAGLQSLGRGDGTPEEVHRDPFGNLWKIWANWREAIRDNSNQASAFQLRIRIWLGNAQKRYPSWQA